MTDPLKLAEEIEGAPELSHVRVSMTEQEIRIITAALRLAEASLDWEDKEPQTPDDVVRLGLAFDAYRAAKEGR